MIAAYEKYRFKSKITGRVYDLKKIVNQNVILETPDGTNQVLTEWGTIQLFYEKESREDGFENQA